MLRFLIIEDDKIIRSIFKTLIKKKFQCTIFEADNGQTGLKILQDKLPDIVFLDISMPVMNGIETLNIIRSNPSFKYIPVIMLTAISDKNIVNAFVEKGISDYLLKPLDHDATISRIQKVISRINEKKQHTII